MKSETTTTAFTKSATVSELHPQNFFKKMMSQKLIVLGSMQGERLDLRIKTASNGEVFAYAFTSELAALSFFPRAKYLAEPKEVVTGKEFFKRLAASKMGLFLNPGFEPPLLLSPAEVKLIYTKVD